MVQDDMPNRFAITPARVVSGLNPPGPIPSYDVPGLRALLIQSNAHGWDCLALAMALTHDEVMRVVNETPPLADGTTDRESVTVVLEALASVPDGARRGKVARASMGDQGGETYADFITRHPNGRWA